MKKKSILQLAIATLGSGVIAAAIFIGGSDPITGQPNPITVDGQTIEFTWTDDNTGEDLEIWTDKATYVDGFSEATVYAAVKNASGVKQDIELMGYFVNQRRYISDMAVLTEVTTPGEDIYEEVCKTEKVDVVASSTEKIEQEVCESKFKQKGDDIVTLEWVNLEQKPRDLFEVSKEDAQLAKKTKFKKSSDGYIAEFKSFEYTINPDEVIYYRLNIQYPANDDGNFFLEAIGSEGGYGHLDPWFDAAWDYRVSVTIDATKVPSTQTSFPVYVDLSDLPAAFHTNVKTDGCDIRVVESDETTETAFELVSYDSGTDTGELHFMADSLDGTTDTTFWIYYSNAAASCYAVTDTYGRNAVWSDYDGVWHFNDTTSGQTDSTGSSGDLTQEMGNPTEGATCALDDCVSYDGNDSHITTGNTYDAMTASSIQFIAKRDNTTGTNRAVAIYGDSFTGGNYQMAWTLDIIGAGSSKLYYSHYKSQGSAATNRQEIVGTTNYGSGSFVWATATWDGSGNFVVYGNGVQEATATNANMNAMYNVSATYDKLYVGRYENQYGDRYWTGDIDEIRIRESVLSANWITTEYNNQNSPSTFYIAGAQETNGGAARRIIRTIIGF